ncbi:DUF397 domain-containing protein [Saccharothrix hoggarensis]|uniref:DUF397 domain-containing protein n=1 Tax=Saccharothrix hoggarensis TaxID=913853 RepID=A0ABW3R410_9PSEU
MKHRDLSGAAWRKSTFSGSGESCVEVAPVGERVAARDSKHPTGPTLSFAVAEWRRFLAGLEDGRAQAVSRGW